MKNIEQEHKRKSNLKHLIILLLRILTITALVIAFAQPFIPRGDGLLDKNRLNYVSIYIDNSFSMQTVSVNGSVLADAIIQAENIIDSYAIEDRFQVYTNDRVYKSGRFYSAEEAKSFLSDIQYSLDPAYLSEVIDFHKESTETINNGNKLLYVLSDFQLSFLDSLYTEPDSTTVYEFVPYQQQNVANVFIDSCWFENRYLQKDQQLLFKARITNHGSVSLEKFPVKLFLNDIQKSLTTVDLEPFSSEFVSFLFLIDEPGSYYGEIKINDYPISFDDQFYFSFKISPSLNILQIYQEDENSYVRRVFENDNTFVYTSESVDRLSYDELKHNNVIILNEIPHYPSGMIATLKRYVQGGGNLIVIPTPAVNKFDESFNELIQNYGITANGLDSNQTELDFINVEHQVFEDVIVRENFEENEKINLPAITKQYRYTFSERSTNTILLNCLNGTPFLLESYSGNGKFYLFSTALQEAYTSFYRHSLFLPVFYKIAFLSETIDPPYLILGSNEGLNVIQGETNGELVYQIRTFDGTFECIPELVQLNNVDMLFTHSQIVSDGLYNLFRNNEFIKHLAYNRNRQESMLIFYTVEEISKMFKTYPNIEVRNQAQFADKQSAGSYFASEDLWKLFIIFALAFLMTEVLLLRFWK